MRILFLHVSTWAPPEKGFKISLGLAYLAAYMKARGHEVRGIDMHYPFEAVPERYLKDDPELISRIIQWKPDIIGMGCVTANRWNVYYWAKILKSKLPETKIVVGGPHVTYLWEQVLNHQPPIDYIVKFEGERPFADLAQALCDKQPLAEVCGIAYRNENGVAVSSAPAEPIKDLDSLPFPNRDCFDDIDELMSTGMPTEPSRGDISGPVIHMISSRGCPFRCKFCSGAHFWGGKIRFRSPENVVAELSGLYKRWPQARHLVFHDDTITSKREHIEGICRLMIERKLEYRWEAWSRLDVIDSDLLELMKRAGCVDLRCGIESGCKRVIKTLQKGINLDAVPESVRTIEASGIRGSYSFIVGLPGEEFAEAQETVLFARNLSLPWEQVRVNFGTWIYPGTGYYDDFTREHGPFDWEDPPVEALPSFSSDPAGNPINLRYGFENQKAEALIEMEYFPRIDLLRRHGFSDVNINIRWRGPVSVMTAVEAKMLAFVDAEVVRGIDPSILVVKTGRVDRYLVEEYRRLGADALGVELDEEFDEMKGRFDIVTALCLFSCVSTTDATIRLQALQKLLADNGCIIVVIPNDRHLWRRVAGGAEVFACIPPLRECLDAAKSAGLVVRKRISAGCVLPSIVESHLAKTTVAGINSMRMPAGLGVVEMLSLEKK